MTNNLLLVEASNPEFIIIGHLLDNKLMNVYFESHTAKDKVGSVYLGKVVNVVQPLSAYFIDYGTGKNGFLSFASCSKSLIKDEKVIVQVAKNEKDNKGAKLTSVVKLNNEYGTLHTDLWSSPKFKPKMRAEYFEEMELHKLNIERNKLEQTWRKITEKAASMHNPGVLYEEEELIKRILRKINNTTKVVIDGHAEFAKVQKMLEYSAHQVEEYKKTMPIFYEFGIHNDIKNLQSRTVTLKSGGLIAIDIAEAMVSIDVNSSSCLSGNLEETSFNVNIEAANEIAKQIRLRDLSGIIAIDFIDMHNLHNVVKVEEAFRQAMQDDQASVRIASINDFGVMLLSRQRSNFNVYEMVYERCKNCIGYGFIPTVNSMAFDILSEIRLSLVTNKSELITVECRQDVAEFLLNNLRSVIYNLEKHGTKIHIFINSSLVNTFNITPKGIFVPQVKPKLAPTKEIELPKEVIKRISYIPAPDLYFHRPYVVLGSGQIIADL